MEMAAPQPTLAPPGGMFKSITNDPNRPDAPEYIVRLLGQVITVSLETVKMVKALPSLRPPIQS
jgi:hypothetical protein